MQTSEVLHAAADHIQVYGHRKFGLGKAGEPTCALGAIGAIVGDDWMEPAVVLSAYLNIDGHLAVWNNAPERTAGEVIEAFRACAVIEQSRERQPAEAVLR